MIEKLQDRRVAALCTRFSNVVKDRLPEDQQIRHLVQQVIYLEEACRSVAESIRCLEKSDDSETQRITAWELKTDFQFLRTLLNEKRFLSALKLIEDDPSGADHWNDCAFSNDQTPAPLGPDAMVPEVVSCDALTDPHSRSDQPGELSASIEATADTESTDQALVCQLATAELHRPTPPAASDAAGAILATDAAQAEQECNAPAAQILPCEAVDTEQRGSSDSDYPHEVPEEVGAAETFMGVYSDHVGTSASGLTAAPQP